MKRLSALLLVLVVLAAFTASAFAATNDLAKGVETVTHAPFQGLKDANDHYAHSSFKDLGHGTVDVFDKARALLVSLGLNLGQPTE